MESTQAVSQETEEPVELPIDTNISVIGEIVEEEGSNVKKEKQIRTKKQQLKYRYCLVCKRRCPSYYVQIFTTVPTKREQWIFLLGSECEETKKTLTQKLEEIKTKNTYICYDHFDPSQFLECFVSRSLILSRNATPQAYNESNFVENRHDVKQIQHREETSAEGKPKGRIRKTNPKPKKMISYKTQLFKEILAIPTERLTPTEWVKLQINLELLRRIRKKAEIYEYFCPKQSVYSLLIDVPC